MRKTLCQREVTAQVVDADVDIGDKIDVERFISKEEALQVRFTGLSKKKTLLATSHIVS